MIGLTSRLMGRKIDEILTMITTLEVQPYIICVLQQKRILFCISNLDGDNN